MPIGARRRSARLFCTPALRDDRVLVSNVSGPRMADIVRAAVAQAWQVEPEFVTSSATAGGVRNAYRQPQQLGVDRWLAIIGAHAIEHAAVCVVSVGTALTIDGVAADGRHLGGVIVPGPDLMLSSLLRNTSDIAQRAQQGSASNALFADNTLGAIQQGAEHALAALVERAVGVMRFVTAGNADGVHDGRCQRARREVARAALPCGSGSGIARAGCAGDAVALKRRPGHASRRWRRPHVSCATCAGTLQGRKDVEGTCYMARDPCLVRGRRSCAGR